MRSILDVVANTGHSPEKLQNTWLSKAEASELFDDLKSKKLVKRISKFRFLTRGYATFTIGGREVKAVWPTEIEQCRGGTK